MGTYFFQNSEWGHPGGHRPRLGARAPRGPPHIVTPLPKTHRINRQGKKQLLAQSAKTVFPTERMSGKIVEPNHHLL